MSIFFDTNTGLRASHFLCSPGGTSENSPGFQAWDRRPNEHKVPKGRQKSAAHSGAITSAGQQRLLHAEKAAEDSRTPRRFAKTLPRRIPPGFGVRLSSAAFSRSSSIDRHFQPHPRNPFALTSVVP